MGASRTGPIHVHERGFGFVNDPVGTAFVPPPLLNGLLQDDVVVAEVELSGDRATARAVQLVSRPRTELYGRVQRVGGGRRVLRVDRAVSNTDWGLDGADDVDDGVAVVARVEGSRARLVSIVAPSDERLTSLCVRHRLLRDAEPDVEGAALAVEPVERVIAAELPRRRDLRGECLVTIDGPSTKDIDDAVGCFAPDDDGALRVLVAIADVAALVTEGGALDVDARRRGTTVYLPDRVFPMLPRRLSEDALSLVAGKDRLCLGCELRIDADGQVTAVDVFEGVMRSQARLDYDAVAAFLDRGDEDAIPAAVAATVRRLRAAAARLGVTRAARGGVSVDRAEARVHLADDGKPVGVLQSTSTSAHLLIERLMVAANEGVARWCHDRGLPTLYRVHDAPDLERTSSLADAAAALGIEAGFSRRRALSPRGLAAFDAQIEGTANATSARLLMRRLLGPARYTPEPLPHFGLAAPLYLHFTSPIRRYADLQVHRQLKRWLRGDRDVSSAGLGLAALATTIDDAARRAARAEEERFRTLVAETLVDRVGDVVNGRVVGHKPFGALVQLPGIVATLPQGEAALGAAVDVRIVAVDVELGRVEVALMVSGPAHTESDRPRV
jgi:ribonuclease R